MPLLDIRFAIQAELPADCVSSRARVSACVVTGRAYDGSTRQQTRLRRVCRQFGSKLLETAVKLFIFRELCFPPVSFSANYGLYP